MYRRSLILLWTGTIVFGAAATLDAFLDYMRNAQGALIGATATCAVCAVLRIGFHQLNNTALGNRDRSDQLLGDVEHKSQQLTEDVDRLRCKMDDLDGKVGEARDWAEVAAMMEDAKKSRTSPDPDPDPDREPCPIYQLRLHDGRREAIVGTRTPDPIDPASIWSILDDSDTGTLPGTNAS
jgi:hypothetical protein